MSRKWHTFVPFALCKLTSCLIETDELPVRPPRAASSSPSSCQLLFLRQNLKKLFSKILALCASFCCCHESGWKYSSTIFLPTSKHILTNIKTFKKQKQKKSDGLKQIHVSCILVQIIALTVVLYWCKIV